MGHDAVRYARCDTRLEKRRHGEKETLRPEQEFRKKAFIRHSLLLQIGCGPSGSQFPRRTFLSCGDGRRWSHPPIQIAPLDSLTAPSSSASRLLGLLRHQTYASSALPLFVHHYYRNFILGRHQPTSLVLYRCHVACFCGWVLLLPVASSEGPSRLA